MQRQRHLRKRYPEDERDDCRQQVHQYSARIVPEIRHLPVRPVRWRKQALSARAGDGEAFEAEPSCVLYQRDVSHTEGHEAVARGKSEDQMPRFVQDDLHEYGKDEANH